MCDICLHIDYSWGVITNEDGLKINADISLQSGTWTDFVM